MIRLDRHSPRRWLCHALLRWLLVMAVTCAMLAPIDGIAVEPVMPTATIDRVRVEGNRRIEEAAILAKIGLRRGDTMSKERVRRDLLAVYELGFFEDIVISATETPGGVVLTFRVTEKPAVREVRIVGAKKVSEDDVREAIDIRAFSVLSESAIQNNVQAVRDVYVDKGYYLADIEARTESVTDDQVDLVIEITENRKVLVQRVDFHGNENVPSSKLRRFLKVKPAGIAPWLTSSGTFRQDDLDLDSQTIPAIFMEEGYVDARVDPAKVYLSPDKRFLYVSYHIEEGEQYTLGNLDAEGDFLPEEGLTREAVLEIIDGRTVADIQEETWRSSSEKGKPPNIKVQGRAARLEPGEVFKYSLVGQVMANIEGLYKDQGYAFVNIVPQTIPNPDNLTVDVIFSIELGEKVRIGRISITGNGTTFDKTVRREIQLIEGDIYRGSLLRASRMRLMRLGYFDDVSFSTPRGDGDDVLDLNVQVSEQPTGSFSLGMGYSNLENFVLTGSVSKNNFLGLGYTMSASINWSGLRRQGDVSFSDPYFLDSRWSLIVSGYSVDRRFGTLQIVTGLNEYQRGGSVGVGRYLDQRDDMQLRFDYRLEDVGLTSIDPFRERLLGGDLYRNGLTSSIGTSLTIDKRNNRIFPTEGILASASATMAGGFRVSDSALLNLLGGQFNFVETKFNLRVYQPLLPNSDFLVFRMNSTLGFLHSTDGRVVPFIHRYRAGGINSMRGFNWFSLGPGIRATQTDDPIRRDDRIIIGGDQIWVNNFEIEAPIIRAAGIKAVVFFDAGNAFRDPWGNDTISPLSLRTSIGAGVRWQSPIGPLRFEFGVPLKPLPDERPSVFDFGIGSFF